MQPSRVRYSKAALPHWCHGSGDSQCKAPRDEPSSPPVPGSFTWAAADLAAWQPSILVGVLCASVPHMPQVFRGVLHWQQQSSGWGLVASGSQQPLLTVGSHQGLSCYLFLCVSSSSLICQRGKCTWVLESCRKVNVKPN